ncbi:hypothetical protein KR51_00015710 [Rubidibacter lacunae KORDI 51-2]|uniref:bAvd-like domain-containing protein n=1 Tax=Rubidibacter lacunae KORDI 51-2 TaxID=582515 RepID=U5DPU7_9CHRO|nr:diversity-generating retroelement protein Avd [Rubidibacter lacunae]ERN41725.1 hypothetical protein KR51_00015710 [Rubidibacter lacunae KORDI 51-2]
MSELPIIQRTHDLIKWYVPILNKLPRDHKFMLGDRIVSALYDLLEGLVRARYSRDKLDLLQSLNAQLSVLRHQTRLLLDFELISSKRFQFANQHLDAIGSELGGWIKRQQTFRPVEAA